MIFKTTKNLCPNLQKPPLPSKIPGYAPDFTCIFRHDVEKWKWFKTSQSLKFFQKGVLKDFIKLTWKFQYRSFFLPESLACNVIKNLTLTLAQMFCCESCKFFEGNWKWLLLRNPISFPSVSDDKLITFDCTVSVF